MVMQLRSASKYMVLRSGRVLSPNRLTMHKHNKRANKLRQRPNKLRAVPLRQPMLSYTSPPLFFQPQTSFLMTERMIQDFIDTTQATREMAERTITQALRLGLTLDHAVEYYLERVL